MLISIPLFLLFLGGTILIPAPALITDILDNYTSGFWLTYVARAPASAPEPSGDNFNDSTYASFTLPLPPPPTKVPLDPPTAVFCCMQPVPLPIAHNAPRKAVIRYHLVPIADAGVSYELPRFSNTVKSAVPWMVTALVLATVSSVTGGLFGVWRREVRSTLLEVFGASASMRNVKFDNVVRTNDDRIPEQFTLLQMSEAQQIIDHIYSFNDAPPVSGPVLEPVELSGLPELPDIDLKIVVDVDATKDERADAEAVSISAALPVLACNSAPCLSTNSARQRSILVSIFTDSDEGSDDEDFEYELVIRKPVRRASQYACLPPSLISTLSKSKPDEHIPTIPDDESLLYDEFIRTIPDEDLTPTPTRLAAASSAVAISAKEHMETLSIVDEDTQEAALDMGPTGDAVGDDDEEEGFRYPGASPSSANEHHPNFAHVDAISDEMTEGGDDGNKGETMAIAAGRALTDATSIVSPIPETCFSGFDGTVSPASLDDRILDSAVSLKAMLDLDVPWDVAARDRKGQPTKIYDSGYASSDLTDPLYGELWEGPALKALIYAPRHDSGYNSASPVVKAVGTVIGNAPAEKAHMDEYIIAHAAPAHAAPAPKSTYADKVTMELEFPFASPPSFPSTSFSGLPEVSTNQAKLVQSRAASLESGRCLQTTTDAPSFPRPPKARQNRRHKDKSEAEQVSEQLDSHAVPKANEKGKDKALVVDDADATPTIYAPQPTYPRPAVLDFEEPSSAGGLDAKMTLDSVEENARASTHWLPRKVTPLLSTGAVITQHLHSGVVEVSARANGPWDGRATAQRGHPHHRRSAARKGDFPPFAPVDDEVTMEERIAYLDAKIAEAQRRESMDIAVQCSRERAQLVMGWPVVAYGAGLVL